MLELSVYQWGLALLGALVVGLSKGGLPGAAILTVVLYTMIFDAKDSVGILLPVLTVSNFIAAIIYWKDVAWREVFKLMPFTLVGVLVGCFISPQIDKEAFRPLIGWMLMGLLVMNFLQFWFQRMRGGKSASGGIGIASSWWFGGFLGSVAGVTTLIANIAGPFIGIFFLSRDLQKVTFVASMAWFFFIVNFIKIPLQVNLGGITTSTLKTSLFLAFFAGVSALIAPRIVKYIPQGLFVKFVWSFMFIAAVRLIV